MDWLRCYWVEIHDISYLNDDEKEIFMILKSLEFRNVYDNEDYLQLYCR